jgi:hypothetical protein
MCEVFFLSWEYLWVGIIKPHNKFGNVLSKILEVPAIFVFTKAFPKNTKEKMPSFYFCFNFLREVKIILIPSTDCCICVAVSKNTHIVQL